MSFVCLLKIKISLPLSKAYFILEVIYCQFEIILKMNLSINNVIGTFGVSTEVISAASYYCLNVAALNKLSWQ